MSLTKLKEDYEVNKNAKSRIAILGSPGSGKSMVSSGLLYFAKIFRLRSDAVPEVAKWDKYSGVDMSAEDYEEKKFKKQKKFEEIYSDEFQILIVEAPLIISSIFSRHYRGKNDPVSKKMFKLAQETKSRYTHFFVTRKLVDYYEEFGRNETEKGSDDLHKVTLDVLEELDINYTVINKYEEHVPLQILEMIGAINKK